MTIEISEEEGRELVAIADALLHQPPPPSARPYGCLLVGLAVALFFGFPKLATILGWGRAAGVAALVAAGLLLLAGAALYVFADSFAGGDIRNVEQAVEDLRTHYPGGPRDTLRRAAVQLLVGAYRSSGPTTVGTFEPHEMARRLGPALPYVQAVERFLVQRDKIYRVFTTQ